MVRVTQVKRQALKRSVGETDLSVLDLNTISSAKSSPIRTEKDENRLLSSQSAIARRPVGTANQYDNLVTLSMVEHISLSLGFMTYCSERFRRYFSRMIRILHRRHTNRAKARNCCKAISVNDGRPIQLEKNS